MATIILEPNEIFEHFHSDVSSTILIHGEATFSEDGIERKLEINVPILTPAMKSHILKNVGKDPCMLHCGHSGGKT